MLHFALDLGLPKSVRNQIRQREPQNPAAEIEKVVARATITRKRDLELKAQIGAQHLLPPKACR